MLRARALWGAVAVIAMLAVFTSHGSHASEPSSASAMGGLPSARTPFSPDAVLSDCLTADTTSADVAIEARGSWQLPAKQDVYDGAWYMPEVTWEEVCLFVPPEGDWQPAHEECLFTDNIYNERIYTCQKAYVNRIAARGAGNGFIVVSSADCLGDAGCFLSFNGKTYNLKKKEVRQAIACRNVASAPALRDRPYVLYDSKTYFSKTALSVDNEGLAYGNQDAGSAICLPTPVKPGTYEIDYATTDKTQTFGPSSEIKCRTSGSTVSCTLYNYSGKSINLGYAARMNVIVQKNNVLLKGNLGRK
jgi:hypothetical protein